MLLEPKVPKTDFVDLKEQNTEPIYLIQCDNSADQTTLSFQNKCELVV